MALAQLCAGKLQRLVQLIQHFQRVVQPQQAAIPQAVVALFLVERLQQGLQLTHRELAGVHLQIQHAALHRHAHRDLRRRGLQVAECIAEVDLALCQQGRHALFKEGDKGILVVRAVLRGAGIGLLGQIGLKQPPRPPLCPGVPQQIRRSRKGRHLILPVQKLRVGADGPHVGRIQIELHHRLEGDLIQQQPVGVLDGKLSAQFRQHKAAEGYRVLAGEEKPAAAERIQRGQQPGRIGPFQLPDGVLVIKIAVVEALQGVQAWFHHDVHAAPLLLDLQGQRGQALAQLIAAHLASRLVQGRQRVQQLPRKRYAAGRAVCDAAGGTACGRLHALHGVLLTAQQGQNFLCLGGKGVPPVDKGQRFSVADAPLLFDGRQQLGDALDDILPPAVRNAEAQQRRLAPVIEDEFGFQLRESSLLAVRGRQALHLGQRVFLIGPEKLLRLQI